MAPPIAVRPRAAHGVTHARSGSEPCAMGWRWWSNNAARRASPAGANLSCTRRCGDPGLDTTEASCRDVYHAAFFVLMRASSCAHHRGPFASHQGQHRQPPLALPAHRLHESQVLGAAREARRTTPVSDRSTQLEYRGFCCAVKDDDLRTRSVPLFFSSSSPRLASATTSRCGAVRAFATTSRSCSGTEGDK